MDMVRSGEEEALADWEVGEAFFLFVGEFEDIRKHINGAGALFEEKLHGRVGDDSTSHFAAHEIFDVLGDSGEPKIVFTGTFSKAEEEVGGIVIFHELPGLINDEKATFLFGTHDIPDVTEDDIHSDGAEFVFEVADVENHHGVVDIDIGLLREDTGEGASGVFA